MHRRHVAAAFALAMLAAAFLALPGQAARGQATHGYIAVLKDSVANVNTAVADQSARSGRDLGH